MPVWEKRIRTDILFLENKNKLADFASIQGQFTIFATSHYEFQ